MLSDLTKAQRTEPIACRLCMSISFPMKHCTLSYVCSVSATSSCKHVKSRALVDWQTCKCTHTDEVCKLQRTHGYICPSLHASVYVLCRANTLHSNHHLLQEVLLSYCASAPLSKHSSCHYCHQSETPSRLDIGLQCKLFAAAMQLQDLVHCHSQQKTGQPLDRC